MPFGISLIPNPSRNAPVTSPNVLEQAMAKPLTLPLLQIIKHRVRRRRLTYQDLKNLAVYRMVLNCSLQPQLWPQYKIF